MYILLSNVFYIFSVHTSHYKFHAIILYIMFLSGSHGRPVFITEHSNPEYIDLLHLISVKIKILTPYTITLLLVNVWLITDLQKRVN